MLTVLSPLVTLIMIESTSLVKTRGSMPGIQTEAVTVSSLGGLAVDFMWAWTLGPHCLGFNCGDLDFAVKSVEDEEEWPLGLGTCPQPGSTSELTEALAPKGGKDGVGTRRCARGGCEVKRDGS